MKERQIPGPMWDELSRADEIASAAVSTELRTLREGAIRIGAKYGFTAEELVERGIITPPRKPSPNGLKGSRRA